VNELYQNTWLHFKASGDGSELLESNLPIPNHYQRQNNGSYSLGWLIDGYFHTSNGIEYLNDIIARIMLTIPITQRIEKNPGNYQGDPIKLKMLQNAVSLPSNFKTRCDTDNRYQDATFWAIKLQAIKLIKAYGGWFDYSILEQWANDNFVPDKEKSTINAKCRSVWYWYDKQDFKIYDKRTFKLTRTEHAKQLNEKRKLAAKSKVLEASKSLTVKKKNGNLSAKAIAEETGLHPDTVRKYLKEMGLT